MKKERKGTIEPGFYHPAAGFRMIELRTRSTKHSKEEFVRDITEAARAAGVTEVNVDREYTTDTGTRVIEFWLENGLFLSESPDKPQFSVFAKTATKTGYFVK